MFDALPPPRHRAARGLTDEDRALWRAFVARGVVPLRGRGASPPAPDPAAGAAGAAPAPAALSGGADRPVPSSPRPLPAVPIDAPPPGLEARRWRDLRRGNIRPERTLDLHGLRAAEAHAAVRAFLHAAQVEGLRCVAIVTGRGAAPEGGVLRRELPHWLDAPELRGLLLGAAHPHAARGGAVYLLLRRRRAGRGATPAGARRR
jgi:DNA-nicking Smr family endonuclease